jgi:glucosyl-3-phosphoglycerate synthase
LHSLLAAKQDAISVVVPAREVASTITPIVESLLVLDELIDQVLVVDAASEDGTAELARAAGGEVVQEAELVPELGPVLGKGDAMWRALAAARGGVIAYLDADTQNFGPHFATGVLGPIVLGQAEFAKGGFERPFVAGDAVVAHGGGRVTELMARPLLSAFYPEVAALTQPLAGEVAARRSLFERIPFATGYAVETAMLIDVARAVGPEAIWEVDLGERRQRHQPLQALGRMAYAVLAAVLERLDREGRCSLGALGPFVSATGEQVQVTLVERPPFASLGAPA